VRDVVVLAGDGAARARELAFRLIGAGPGEAIRLAVVDAVRIVEQFQHVQWVASSACSSVPS
jgi:hypothetical protein